MPAKRAKINARLEAVMESILCPAMGGWSLDGYCAEYDYEEGTGCHILEVGCIFGEMDCRFIERDGKPAAEFSWEGHDEDEHVFGRGWVVLEDGQLEGMILFHQGEESGFLAERAEG